ncbi:tetratricopeptide repeat protein [Candidatus Sumerlaeota bacterium]|nr:tetratricopeptide repeat protein [Candidatus Sumerlaeota bacterium]
MIFRHLLFVLLLLAGTAAAQTASSEAVTDLASANKVFEEGNHAFERGDARAALDAYIKVAESGFGDAQVWSNAGTAAYRAGDTGRAVLYYSRALRLDPGYDRARSSLGVVSPATNSLGDGFLTEVIDTLFRRTPPGFWFLAAELLFLLCCFSIARFLAATDRDKRGHWFASLSWSLVLTLACVGVGVADHHFRAGGNSAVVLSDKTVTRSEPREESVAQLELPAGTIVEMTESPQRGFVRFKLADGQSGYISLDQIERI